MVNKNYFVLVCKRILGRDLSKVASHNLTSKSFSCQKKKRQLGWICDNYLATDVTLEFRNDPEAGLT